MKDDNMIFVLPTNLIGRACSCFCDTAKKTDVVNNSATFISRHCITFKDIFQLKKGDQEWILCINATKMFASIRGLK
jgi:hypothetical protein